MSDTRISLEDFYQLHSKLGPNEVVLDVRRPEEYSEGHIPGALNIPVDVVASKVEELKKYQYVYVHCKRGGRAQTAFNTLSGLGLKNVVCIHDAGMDAWIEKGYPVKKG